MDEESTTTSWFWLTGDTQARDAALDGARWVLRADDGNRTIFRWLEDPSDTKWHPAEPSPIIAMIRKRREGGS